MPMREYPAYGRTIAAHLARGEKPLAVAAVLSNRWWHLLDHVPRVCVRAEEWQLGRYEWSYLNGMHVVAFCGDCEEKHFGEMLLELMVARPRMLWAYDMLGNAISAEDPANELGVSALAANLAGLQINHPLFKLARARYQAGIRADAQRELDEHERILARSGLDAAVRWSAERMGWPDLVRKRFAAPLQATGESLPA